MASAPVDLEDFGKTLPRYARLMGVDLGTKTIGLAISDVERHFASPLETIRRVKFTADAHKMLALIDQHAIAAIVMGLPLNMDGSEGPRAQATRAFVRNLVALRAMTVIFWDERLSTAAVTRTLIEQDASRARRAELVDKMAAAYILQGLLDRLASIARGGAARPHPDDPHPDDPRPDDLHPDDLPPKP